MITTDGWSRKIQTHPAEPLGIVQAFRGSLFPSSYGGRDSLEERTIDGAGFRVVCFQGNSQPNIRDDPHSDITGGLICMGVEGQLSVVNYTIHICGLSLRRWASADYTQTLGAPRCMHEDLPPNNTNKKRQSD